MRPLLPTAYNAPSAGRVSMPTTFSPVCKPPIATDVHSFCGVALLNEISLFVSVVASTAPTACAGAVVVDAAAMPRSVSPLFNPVTAPVAVAAPVAWLIA
jgi:hypothetical protein